jgi:hypothetical protein
VFHFRLGSLSNSSTTIAVAAETQGVRRLQPKVGNSGTQRKVKHGLTFGVLAVLPEAVTLSGLNLFSGNGMPLFCRVAARPPRVSVKRGLPVVLTRSCGSPDGHPRLYNYPILLPLSIHQSPHSHRRSIPSSPSFLLFRLDPHCSFENNPHSTLVFTDIAYLALGSPACSTPGAQDQLNTTPEKKSDQSKRYIG